MLSHTGCHEAPATIQPIRLTRASTSSVPTTSDTTVLTGPWNRFRRSHAVAPRWAAGGGREGIICTSALHDREPGVHDVQDEGEEEADQQVRRDDHDGHGHARPGLVGDDGADR